MPSTNPDQLHAFRQQVDAELRRGYGLSWEDASGESSLLENAIADGLMPEQFVRQFAEKYDLDALPEFG